MKNKSFVMKILVIGSILLVLLLLIVIFSLIKLFIPKKQEKPKVEKKIISESYELEDIENISFDFKKSNSIFEISDDENLVIVQNSKEERFFINLKKKNKQLVFEEDSYIINPQKKKYTIYLPKNYLNKITIINGFGDVTLSDVVNFIDINNNAGNITLENISSIKIKDVSGDISIKNAVGDLEIASSTGDITIDNMMGNIKGESITGDITVTKYSVIGDSYFENVSGNIVLGLEESICKIDYSNENGKTKIDNEVCKGDFNILKIKNITGMIKVY